MKAQLGRWAENGAGNAAKAVAAHWAMLCERFGIEDKA